MGGGPNNGVNVEAGTSGPAVAVEMAGRRNITQSFAQRRIRLRFSKALAIGKHGLQCDKLLNVGVDQTLPRRGEKKQPGQNEWQILRI
jgi:hypothetical protein